MTSAIQTDTLVKKFRRVDALQGLTLNVPEGAVYALVGPNGAGKTTAIKILMNIIRATSGRAQVLGIDSTHIKAHVFESIGYVSENQEQPEWMTVGYLLAYLKTSTPRGIRISKPSSSSSSNFRATANSATSRAACA